MKKGFPLSVIAVLLMGCATVQSKMLTSATQPVIHAVRTHCVQSMGVNVEVRSAKLSDRTGRGAFKGVVFGNPTGFLTEQAIKVKEIKLRVVPETLNEEVVVIEKMVIQAPEITYELHEGMSNLEILHRRTLAYIEEYEKKIKFGETVIIRNLYIKKGIMHFSHDWMAGEVFSFPFPDLHLTELELGDEGLSPAELTDKITQEFIEASEKIIHDMAQGLLQVFKTDT